ncbi:beta-lactamase family protein [Sphingomonas sp. QA11]|uniref:serine hydrolase domain-containing protein n=1 Tax=Sphingomonas sp. QA11 TaxID=2950605 RepID=UPI00234ACFE7|nr:serine hydrolase domain-containing protein [Sphingomonas sp. QA11]WCM28711.1 beta-lactamase family protein [Sphingomonas sp. QA11]
MKRRMLTTLALAGAVLMPAQGFGQAQPAPAADEATQRQVGAEILFWSQAQRDSNFPAMEKIFPGNTIKADPAKLRVLPAGKPLPMATADVNAFMTSMNVAGLIVLQDGKVRLERYARGLTAEGRWTSFSVAKSFTSTLVGAAMKDGLIKSLNDPVTRYIPDLAGSGYDGVTVAQLMTMTSGVKWNEDYTDPKSDVARMFLEPVAAGVDPTVYFMRKLPRETTPGTKWVYKTGETNLIGVLVRRATGKTLAAYAEEKIWKPAGMERDGFWMKDQTGAEVSGCCLSVSLRDYARFGQFALEGGHGIVKDGWFADATRAHAKVAPGGYGYGYQWWTYPEGRYGAQGIFGQMITIDPASKVVVAMVSAAPKASDRPLTLARLAFFQKLMAAAK